MNSFTLIHPMTKWTFLKHNKQQHYIQALNHRDLNSSDLFCVVCRECEIPCARLLPWDLQGGDQRPIGKRNKTEAGGKSSQQVQNPPQLIIWWMNWMSQCVCDEAKGTSWAWCVRTGPLHAYGPQRWGMWADHGPGLEESLCGLHAHEQRFLTLTFHICNSPGDL